MKLIEILTQSEIAKSRHNWETLAGDHPFCNWNWMSSWYTVYGNDDNIRIVAFEANGEWHGVLPMIVQDSRQGRALCFASGGRACADYVRPIIKPGSQDIVIPMMAEWLQALLDDRTLGLDLIEFDGVSQDDPWIGHLSTILRQQNYPISDRAGEGCWVAELEPTWEAFQQKIKKSFRRKLRKACKNMELPQMNVEIIDSAKRLEVIWPEFVRLHQLRRKEMGQQGCFAEPEFEAFLNRAIHRMVDKGTASLVATHFDDRVFATMLLLTNSNTTYMYQTGMDPDFKHLEPGHLLGTVAVQQAISRGHQYFDYLRGDEPYKANWQTKRVPLSKWQIVSRRIPSRLRFGFWETGRTIKNWLPGSSNYSSQA